MKDKRKPHGQSRKTTFRRVQYMNLVLFFTTSQVIENVYQNRLHWWCQEGNFRLLQNYLVKNTVSHNFMFLWFYNFFWYFKFSLSTWKIFKLHDSLNKTWYKIVSIASYCLCETQSYARKQFSQVLMEGCRRKASTSITSEKWQHP